MLLSHHHPAALTHFLRHRLTHRHTHRPAHRRTHRHTHRLAHRRTHRHTHRLAHRRTHRFTHRHTHRSQLQPASAIDGGELVRAAAEGLPLAALQELHTQWIERRRRRLEPFEVGARNRVTRCEMVWGWSGAREENTQDTQGMLCVCWPGQVDSNMVVFEYRCGLVRLVAKPFLLRPRVPVFAQTRIDAS